MDTPEHIPADYPVMLYRDGVAYDPESGRPVGRQHTLVVESAEQEDEAKAEGFIRAVLPELAAKETHESPECAEGGDSTTEGDAGHDTLEGGAGADHVEPAHPGDPDHAAAVEGAPAEVDPAAIPQA